MSLSTAATSDQKAAGQPRKKVRNDMDTLYTKKVANCDRRIQRLEEELRSLAAAEQRAADRSQQQQQQKQQQGASPTAGAGGSPSQLRLLGRTVNKEEEDKLIQRLTYVRERPDADALFPPIDNSRPARQMWETLRPDKTFDEDEDGDGEVDIEGMVDRLGVADVEARADNAAARLEDAEANGVGAMWRESVRQISIARRRRTEEDFDEDAMDEEEEEELYTLSEERMEALGARLCTESLEHRRQLLAELEEKYYGADVNKSVEIERSRMKRLAEGIQQPTPQELGARLHDASMAKKRSTMAALEAKYIPPANLVRSGKTGELKELPKLTKAREDDLVARLANKK